MSKKGATLGNQKRQGSMKKRGFGGVSMDINPLIGSSYVPFWGVEWCIISWCLLLRVDQSLHPTALLALRLKRATPKRLRKSFHWLSINWLCFHRSWYKDSRWLCWCYWSFHPRKHRRPHGLVRLKGINVERTAELPRSLDEMSTASTGGRWTDGQVQLLRSARVGVDLGDINVFHPMLPPAL